MTSPSNPGASFGGFRVENVPGLTRDLLNELAPLLAEEGIDLKAGIVPDMVSLQAALDRAVARRNLETFTPVGAARDVVVLVLRATVVRMMMDQVDEAFADLDDLTVAESPDGSMATVAGTIGVALGRLDDVLAGRDSSAPDRLADALRPSDDPAHVDDAGNVILKLAHKGRAFSALQRLVGTYGGRVVQHASVMTLAAAVLTWYELSDSELEDVVDALIR